MTYNYKLHPGREKRSKKFDVKEYANPIISIITPFFNSGKYIEETANAVLNQTFPNFEWIIVNDGSTNENSLEELKKIEAMDNRIKVYHKENGGPAVARDYAVTKMSKGSKYIMFLDDDDVIVNTYLECAYITLETNPKAAWAYTDVVNFSGEEYLWRKWFSYEKEKRENLLVMTSLIKREAFESIGGFALKEKAINEDWIFWLKLLQKGYFPVRMNFYGFWYRKKKANESELARSQSKENLEITMGYIKNLIEKENSELEAIQYPKQDYNWDLLPEGLSNIEIAKLKKDNKIQILMIIPWFTVGGSDKFNLDMIKRMDKSKYNFTIVTTEPSNNPWRQEFEEYADVYDLTTFLDRKYWAAFLNYIIEKNNIDIIFNSNSTFGYSALPYLKISNPNIPIMDYVHMEEWYNRNGGYSRDSSAVASVIDKTYVCNRNSEEILVNHFGRNTEDVGTIYIGGDEKEFNPEKYSEEDIENILKDKKIKKNGKYIISYICRISNQKRPYLLLEVIKRLQKERNDFIFVIGGDGPMFKEIKAKAKHLNIDKNMVFLGNVKNTKEVYAISDMTINCSIKEGLALTAYESLLMGVPVLSSDVGGQKELINEDVGVIVPCMQKEEDINVFEYKDEEVQKYVDGINKILNNIKKYKSNARKRVLNGFTIDNMVVNMEKAFKEMYENPNKQKIEDAKGMSNNLDMAKELITKFFTYNNEEYNWMCRELNKDICIESDRYEIPYEFTLEYKIKHPFYVILNKLGIYKKIEPYIKTRKKKVRNS